MPLCKLCQVNEGIYKVRDKKTREEFFICEFCDEPDGIELIETKEVDKKSEEPSLGRLHLVKKCKKEAYCRVKGCKIEVGSRCYTQSIHQKPFPIQTRVCEECAEELIKNGSIVA